MTLFFFLTSPETVKAARSSLVRPDADRIQAAKQLAQNGKIDEAVKKLKPAIEGEKAADRRGLMRMALAMIFFRAGQTVPAEEQFSKAIADGVRVSDLAHFYLGLIRQRAGKNHEAHDEFQASLRLKPPEPSEIDVRFQIARLEIEARDWKTATSELDFLRKRLKNDERYAEVVFDLLLAHKKLGRRTDCKLARELFAKFPAVNAVTELAQWGPHLDRDTVAGQKTGCHASIKDIKSRIHRLWLAGDEKRADDELKDLRGMKAVKDQHEDDDDEDDDGEPLVESLYIHHLLGEGHIDAALKILMSKYDRDRMRPAFLLLVAKAASAAGEYQMAISSYQRAFELAPKEKNGLNALFQAAFTSYQIQDYDGASRRFAQLLHVSRNSRWTREASWYLAWMRYLRGDYAGAVESFRQLGKLPLKAVARRRGRKRGRRIEVVTDSIALDRVQYWSAMSLYKMGKIDQALPILQKLAADPAIGYYAILAYYRLLSIPNAKLPVGVESRLGLKSEVGAPPSEETLKAAAAASAVVAREEFADRAGHQMGSGVASDGATDVTTDLAEGDETEAAANGADEAFGDPAQARTQAKVDATDADESTDESDLAASQEEEPPSNFKDPRLALRFERARDLALIGLDDQARRELLEIEKRARSTPDRRLLMSEYAAVKSYERSSYIGELGFGPARLRTGLRGESRVYWEFAYPRAYEQAVETSGRASSVPEEMIWGIMRAESHFRADARSPVGALGLMQMMPFTGRKVADLLSLKSFAPQSLLDPETNIKLGARYLQRLFDKFSGKVPLVAGAYNAGPHRVLAWVRNFGSLDMDEFIEHIPYVETRNYVKRVVRNFQIYGLLYHGRSRTMNWLIEPVGVRQEEVNKLQQEIW